MNLTRGINLRKIAELMPGASGAEVKVRIGPLKGSSWVVNLMNTHLDFFLCIFQGVCTEAGMYALRERRVHVTQEDFEMAVAKVCVTVCFYSVFWFRNLTYPSFVMDVSTSTSLLTLFHVLFPRWCRKTARRTCRSRNCGSKRPCVFLHTMQTCIFFLLFMVWFIIVA